MSSATRTVTLSDSTPDIDTEATGEAGQEQASELVAPPQVGALMKRGKEVGRVVDRWLGTVYLRPVGGGKEWTASPEELEPVTTSDVLSPRVAEANKRSRGEL